MDNIRNFSRLPVLLMFFIFALVLAGCSLTSATAIQYNSPAPPEKNCTINIASTIIVRKFDGQNVDWRPGFGANWAQVNISEGSHTIVFDYEHSAGAGTFSSYKATGLSVTYDMFVAGHTYLMAAQPFVLSARSMSIRVGIKDVTNEPDWGSFSKAFNWTSGFEWLPINK